MKPAIELRLGKITRRRRTDRCPSALTPARLDLRHLCGSRPARAPPAPAPPPPSSASSAPNRDRHAIDLHLGNTGVKIGMAPALATTATNRTGRRGPVHHGGHEPGRLTIGTRGTPPAQQLLRCQSMPPRDLRHHRAGSQRLLNDARLVIRREPATPFRSRYVGANWSIRSRELTAQASGARCNEKAPEGNHFLRGLFFSRG